LLTCRNPERGLFRPFRTVLPKSLHGGSDPMQAFFENFVAPGLGNAEFFVGVLVACGFLMIGISSLLPKSGDEELEWWER
jgi:hypothetical protein